MFPLQVLRTVRSVTLGLRQRSAATCAFPVPKALQHPLSARHNASHASQGFRIPLQDRASVSHARLTSTKIYLDKRYARYSLRLLWWCLAQGADHAGAACGTLLPCASLALVLILTLRHHRSVCVLCIVPCSTGRFCSCCTYRILRSTTTCVNSLVSSSTDAISFAGFSPQPCPDQKRTSSTGTADPAHCLDLCTAGFYGAAVVAGGLGIAPCAACPVGFSSKTRGIIHA